MTDSALPQSCQFTVSEGLQFLKRDNEFSKRALETEIEAKKQVVKSVEAFTMVGAFIAGVQAQVNASTFERNDTNLQVAANGFGFVGLALDILGTSFGVMHALKLHRSIRQLPTLLRSRSREQLNDMVEQLSGEDGTKVGQALKEKISERKKFWVQSPLQSHLLYLFSAAGADPLTATLGLDPMLAMGGGIVCLLVSILCFVADTQPRAVWVLCLVMSTIMASSMICGMWIHHEVGSTGTILSLLDTNVQVDRTDATDAIQSFRFA